MNPVIRDLNLVPQSTMLYHLFFHEQNNDISSQLNKFKDDPVFHVGPII